MIVRITCSKAGFRRCGIAHPDTPVDYPEDRFTPEEIERLKAEPRLTVEFVKESERRVSTPQAEDGDNMQGKPVSAGNKKPKAKRAKAKKESSDLDKSEV